MITAVGNCPSSGSTLLADLLDSTPFTACGNELGLLAQRSIYDFATYRTRIRRPSPASPIHLRRGLLNFDRLHTYGLSEAEYGAMVGESEDLRDFLGRFARRYLALRGREPEGMVFEKTPQNVGCIGEFTSALPDHRFVHIVRNPVYVIQSLMKRGFGPWLAAASWLVDEAKYLRYADRENVILVTYEDLVRDPFPVAARLIEDTTGRTISPEACRERYERNDFRRQFSKKQVRGWTVREYGTVRDLGEVPVAPEALAVVKSFLSYRVSDGYAAHADVEPITFAEAIGRLGYDEDVRRRTADAPEAPLAKTTRDRIRLFRKYLFDLRAGGGRPRPFAFLNAVVRAG